MTTAAPNALKVAQYPDDERLAGDVVVFSVGDVDYKALHHIGPNVQLRYMRYLRKHGPLYALADLIEHVLGSDAMDVLTAHDDLTSMQMREIGDLVERVVSGGDPLAPSGDASS